MTDELEGTTETGAADTDQARLDELGAIFDAANDADDAVDTEAADSVAVETPEGPARSPDGKFAAKELPDSVSDNSTAEQKQAVAESADAEGEPETGLAAPASWTAAEKAAWPGMAPEVQEAILRREADWQRTDGERGNKLKGYEPIEAALEPVRRELELQGVQPGQYVSQLVAADRFLKAEPQKALAWIAQQYGISLPAEQTEQAYADPSVAPLYERINGLEQTLQASAQQQELAEQGRIQQDIDAFAADPAHEHFAAVREEMGHLIQAGLAPDLQTAYDKAVLLNPVTSASVLAEKSAAAEAERQKEAAERAAKAKRVSATNLSSKGTAGGQTPPAYDTREDELSAIYDQVQGA